jgi:ATP-dependent DNA helicase RecG
MSDLLTKDIKYLNGVGPKRAELFNNELNIFTIKDLLYHFPYKYIDRSQIHKINTIKADMPYVQLKGEILNIEMAGGKTKKRLVAEFTDGTGVVELVWFQGIKWINDRLKINKKYIVFGKPSVFNNRINIAHPEIEEEEKNEVKIKSSLQALYPTTEKLKANFINSKVISKLLTNVFLMLNDEIEETLPEYLLKKLNLLSITESLKNIHFPADNNSLKKAQYRLKFEELFDIQLDLLYKKFARQKKFSGFKFEVIDDYFNNFYKQNLQFELTDAQKRVIKEIRKDMGSGKQMNRLLQGDVGSGKTLVALMSMLIALDNGYQACLMAPTEILANQHYNTILNFLKGLNVEVRLLTGSTKKNERKFLFNDLEEGKIQILIGTHALIEENVKFNKLGLVIIDEQHKFGVAQRAKLWTKSIPLPHILVMTATPIPRTLAMTLYGDLDISVIDQLPPGRKPIKTMHFFDSHRLYLFGFLKKMIEEGRQVYIVYPLIKESEKMDYKNLEDGIESISRAFPPPKYAISVVHGQMKNEDKEISMKYFIEGKTQIMVATTVIEVGVDIPNASVMVIESAERFGLSQLHQLRGRVGRGSEQSYCILMTSDKLTSDARIRIDTMIKTNDGFEIAETDLQLRGPGDIEGTQQSGIPFDLKIANLAKDGHIVQFSRDIANEILSNDPKLHHPDNALLLKKVLSDKKALSWSFIS